MISAALEKLAARKKAAAPFTAKRLLADSGTCALALLIAAKDILGEWHEWEPETLWMTLSTHNVEIPVGNRAKLLAAHTLLLVPSFYWDGVVFEKTALALDGVEPNPEMLEEATSAQLAWAVIEAAHIRSHHSEPVPPFDHEPCVYAAVVMHREGLVVAPEQLQFAQEHLDGLNGPLARDLYSEVERRWNTLDKKTLAEHPFDESPEGVQMGRLAAVHLHLQEREAATAADLAALRT